MGVFFFRRRFENQNGCGVRIEKYDELRASTDKLFQNNMILFSRRSPQ